MAAYPQVGTRGTGRHKEAITRVRLIPGKGNVIINGKPMEQFLGKREVLHMILTQPLDAAGVRERYTVLVTSTGGGLVGVAKAARLGIARALSEISDSNEEVMRKEGFMTRDPRVKERKKYGRKKARKRFQFSKR